MGRPRTNDVGTNGPLQVRVSNLEQEMSLIRPRLHDAKNDILAHGFRLDSLEALSKASGLVDWRMVMTNVVSSIIIGILATIAIAIWYYAKANV